MYASPKRSALVSGLLHAAAIVLVLVVTTVRTPPTTIFRSVSIAGRDISQYIPHSRATGGGGGGARDGTRANKGVLPKSALRQFTAPVARILNDNPRLAMDAALLGPPDVSIGTPNAVFGDPNGILGPLSNGRGSGSGIGDGDGGGVGDRHGPGANHGDDGGGISGGSGIRGLVTAPVLQWKSEPEYTEDARKAKLQGTVMLRIRIDSGGLVRNVAVVHSLGLGLDERAVESVRRWRFRPAYANGKPASTDAVVEVSFRLL